MNYLVNKINYLCEIKIMYLVNIEVTLDNKLEINHDAYTYY